MNRIELLSPAGSWDSLKAAISSGADAVYLGSGIYNARRRAENFSASDLGKVVSFCHEKGVRAYLAANTLVKNGELGAFFDLAANAYSSGMDAVIVQHVSFVPVLKKHFPGMEIHLSTQAGVFNPYYSRLIGGADRVILPRELSLKEIKEFREETSIPVEVFVQGALCFSMSGQCLMSSFLGGRSGNRGLCAQPCRKRYDGKYLLSARDLCLIQKLPEIADAGVSSIKIEGRLRSPEYVAAATSLYRRALDSMYKGHYEVDADAFMDLELAFNREYTPGRMFKDADVVTPDAGGKRGIPLGRLGRDGTIRLRASLRIGDGVGIISKRGMHGDHVKEMFCGGRRVESAREGRSVRLAINAKEGDELVLTSGMERRRPYKFCGREKIIVERNKPAKVSFPETNAALGVERILVKAYSLDDALAALVAGADRAYYNVFANDFPSDGSIGAYVSRCLSGWNARKAVDLINAKNPASILCGDAGVAANVAGREVYLDVSGNVFNDLDVGFFNARRIIPIISPELSFDELLGFSDKRFAVYAHGRLPLMSTKYDLKEERVADEKGYLFPVRAELEVRQVLNSVVLGLFDDVLRLRAAGITQYLLDLEENVSGSVYAYKKILTGRRMGKPPGVYTLGNYRRGVL